MALEELKERYEYLVSSTAGKETLMMTAVGNQKHGSLGVLPFSSGSGGGAVFLMYLCPKL